MRSRTPCATVLATGAATKRPPSSDPWPVVFAEELKRGDVIPAETEDGYPLLLAAIACVELDCSLHRSLGERIERDRKVLPRPRRLHVGVKERAHRVPAAFSHIAQTPEVVGRGVLEQLLTHHVVTLGEALDER